MSRDLFDEVVGMPPPSTIDVTAIVTRRRRVMVARRWGVTMASAVVAVVAIVAGLAWAPPGTSLGPPADPAGPGFSLAMDSGQAGVETAQQLAEAWATALAEEVPQARWSSDGTPPTIQVSSVDDKPGVLFAGTGVLLSEGRQGNLNLSIMRDTCGSGVAPSSCAGLSPPAARGLVSCDAVEPRFTCVSGQIPNGAPMVLLSDLATDPRSLASSAVRVGLPGSLVLDLSVDNMGVDESTGATKPRQLATVLTVAQLSDVARAIAERIRA